MDANDNEIKKRFRRLSLIYHPDRYSPNLGITPGEATAHFQMLNNANEFLRANQD
jgi:curved DNA-binding protein CbpA